MKCFAYLIPILLTTTVSFAGHTPPSEENAEGVVVTQKMQRSVSMPDLRKNKESSLEHPRSFSTNNPKLLMQEEDSEEFVLMSSVSPELPSLKSLVNLKNRWGFNLALVVERQTIVRRDSDGKYGPINKEPAVQVVNLGNYIERSPELACLSLCSQKKIIQLIQEKNEFEQLIQRYQKQLTPEKEEKLEDNKDIKEQIKALKKKIVGVEAEFESYFEGDSLPSLTIERAGGHLKAIVQIKEKIMEFFQELGITTQHLHLLPPRDAWLPSLESLVNLRERCGFNLSLVLEREGKVRKYQKIYWPIDEEPAVHIVNLGTSKEKVPKLASLSPPFQKAIIKLATKKMELENRIRRYKRKLNQKEGKKLEDGLSLVKEQIEIFEIRIKHIQSEFEEHLKRALLKPPFLTIEIAYGHLKSIVKVKDRIMGLFQGLGITTQHLHLLPPRGAWDKLRPFATIRRFPTTRGIMSPRDRRERREGLEEFYGPPNDEGKSNPTN